MILSTYQNNYLSITTTQETTLVDITFPFLQERDIDVFTGTHKLSLGIDYTVIGSPDQTAQGRGQIRFTAPVVTGTHLFFIRNTEEVRITDFEAAAYFEEKLLDAEFNNMIRQLQDSKMYLTTAPHIHPTNIGQMTTELPPAFPNAVIVVNERNDAFTYVNLYEHPALVEAIKICTDKAAEAKASADAAKNSADYVDSVYTTFSKLAENQKVVETVTLAANQTEVNFSKVFVNASTIFVGGLMVDRGRLLEGTDYNVATISKIVLARRYPAGTQISAEQYLQHDTDNTASVWNRRIVDMLAQNTFADYQDEGRTLTPRLSFEGSHYLPMFDSSVPVTFTGLPRKNGDGTITVATDKGDRQFSRVIAEAVAREDMNKIVYLSSGDNKIPKIDVDCSLIGVDLQTQTSTSITANANDTTFSIPNTDDFVVGKYAFVTGNRSVSGCFKVLSKTQNSITVSMVHPHIDVSQAATVKPIVSVIKVGQSEEFEIGKTVFKMSNVVVETTAPYGIIVGSKYEQGFRKPTGRIVEANYVHVEGSTRVAWMVGGSGSSVGVNNISAGNCKIGILSAYSASVVGSGAFVYKAGEDVFKCEHSGDMYLTNHNGIFTTSESMYGVRYSSAQEMADGFCVMSTGAMGTSQFNSYLSVRNVVAHGECRNIINSVDAGAVALSNVDASTVVCTNSIRAINNSTVRSVTGVSTLGTIQKFEISDSTVELNGTIYSGRKVVSTISAGTISANARFSTLRTMTGYDPENNVALNLTVLQNLPIGIIPFVIGTQKNEVRVVLQNVSGSSVSVGDVKIAITY